MSSNSKLEDFFLGMEEILIQKAKEKGYNSKSPEQNELMDFMHQEFPDHALGEIVYKAVRFKAKKNPEDLIKIASWAALIWLQENK